MFYKILSSLLLLLLLTSCQEMKDELLTPIFVTPTWKNSERMTVEVKTATVSVKKTMTPFLIAPPTRIYKEENNIEAIVTKISDKFNVCTLDKANISLPNIQLLVFHEGLWKFDLTTKTQESLSEKLLDWPSASPNHLFFAAVTDYQGYSVGIFNVNTKNITYYLLRENDVFQGWSSENELIIAPNDVDYEIRVDPKTLKKKHHPIPQISFSPQPYLDYPGYLVRDVDNEYFLYTALINDIIFYNRVKASRIVYKDTQTYNMIRPIWNEREQNFLFFNKGEGSGIFSKLKRGFITIDTNGNLNQLLEIDHFPQMMGDQSVIGYDRSEDGNWLYIQVSDRQNAEQKTLRGYVVNVQTGEIKALCEAEKNIRGGWWVSDNYLVYLVDNGENEKNILKIVNTKTWETMTLLELNKTQFHITGWVHVSTSMFKITKSIQ